MHSSDRSVIAYARMQPCSYVQFLTSKGTMEIDRAGIKTTMEIDRAGIKTCEMLQHVLSHTSPCWGCRVTNNAN